MARLYHFLSREHGLSNLVNRRLKIATLNDINDPFEISALYSSDRRERAALRRFKEEWAERYGMLCFSRTWSNPVQWSHYGEKHKGLCLGFDVYDGVCSNVTYSSERLKLDRRIFAKEPDFARVEAIKWSTTKFEHWSYEQETRVFLALKERGDRDFYWCPFNSKIQLREIIVGPLSDISRSDLQSAISPDEGKVEFYKARLSFQKYRVVRQRRAELWR